MKRAFPPKSANDGKKKTQGAVAVSNTGCKPQSEVDYIMYVLMHWQVGVKLTDMNPGTERDWLTKFCRQHCNRTKTKSCRIIPVPENQFMTNQGLWPVSWPVIK